LRVPSRTTSSSGLDALGVSDNREGVTSLAPQKCQVLRTRRPTGLDMSTLTQAHVNAAHGLSPLAASMKFSTERYPPGLGG
jgi:hypothetical protein